MTPAKVYTFAVRVTAGELPEPRSGMTKVADHIFEESITVNVEADDLEAAREQALEQGEEFAEDVLPSWQETFENSDYHQQLWERHVKGLPVREERPKREDVDVTASFEDLVVGATIR